MAMPHVDTTRIPVLLADPLMRPGWQDRGMQQVGQRGLRGCGSSPEVTALWQESDLLIVA